MLSLGPTSAGRHGPKPPLPANTLNTPAPWPDGSPRRSLWVNIRDLWYQAKTRPPSFAIFCSRPTKVPDSYLRYLENALREDFDLPGTPIRLILRKGENPYAPKKK